MSKPRILVCDIESAPSLVHVWQLYDVTVSLNQLMEAARMICFAAKWTDSKRMMFHSEFHDGREKMVQAAWNLIDEADILVGYNSAGYDMKHLNREFALAGLTPPSPVKHVDLYRTVKANFKFASGKLDHVASELGLGNKVSTGGHGLWVACMAGDEKAWRKMRAYNRADVALTHRLYDRLLPWIPSHPHRALYSGEAKPSCGRCGGTQLQRRGCQVTPTGRFQRFQCQGCGGWSRAGKSEARVDVRPV